MTSSLYITSAEGHTGKSTIALGVLETLQRRARRVGVFRPIARSTDERDYVLDLLLAHDGVEVAYDDSVGVTYDEVHADPDAALARIVERYKAVEAQCDAVVIVGSDYTDVGSPTELGYNARIAVNLGAPVLLVLGGRLHQGGDERLGRGAARTPEAMGQLAELSLTELRLAHASLLGVVVNRADGDRLGDIRAAVSTAIEHGASDWSRAAPVWTIPEEPVLVAPSVRGVMESIDGELLAGDEELLGREALDVVVGRHVDGERVAAPHRGLGRGGAGRSHRGAPRGADGERVRHVPLDRRGGAERRVRPARAHRATDRRPQRSPRCPSSPHRLRHLRHGGSHHRAYPRHASRPTRSASSTRRARAVRAVRRR